MRFIIKEQSYEQLLASGELRYAHHGRDTGAVEQWRLTTAVDDYRFLRVDLDARNAESGNSSLFHATLNPSGRCEMLKYRFWGQGLMVSGTLVLEDDAAVNGRDVNGTRYEDLLTLEPGYGFWFPSSMGLALLKHAAGTISAVTLNSATTDPAAAFSLVAHPLDVQELSAETLNIMGQAVGTRPRQIQWQDQTRTLWLDNSQWPVKMRRNDGLTATETRLRRISNPA